MLLADKAVFPRDKPCGGGMTLRAVRQCPVDPTPVVEELVDQVELRFRYGASVVHKTKEPVVWMTQRSRLDAFLLDAARERGVEVREGVKVGIEAGNTVTLGPRERVTCATRSSAPTVRTASLQRRSASARGLHYGVAYEGNVRYPTLPRERYARRARARARRHPGRLRLGVPQGRPRERRRRRLAERGPEAPRASATRLRGARARPRRARGAPRAPAAAAPAGHSDRGRARAPRRRRSRADRPGLGRRDVRVLRLLSARSRLRSSTCSAAAPRPSSPTPARSTASLPRSTARRGS